ncbi:MAG: hypothetical protein CL535_16545 [Ahrensia sp.]|nr:hypothetical protein [Ahrensia sp.]MBV48183.1 hypothetical protein [Roseobacter sp.]MBV48284.1 hypothetical protein [Roseobacter sp.]|tara:strand:- start:149800 stop:150009 length:210 start_codon:yes stop_codon:yes gene_type:complete
MADSEYTATLERWSFAHGYYFGAIYGDKKERFADGSVVRTSLNKSKPGKEGDIITTSNSRYLLGKPATT